MRGWVIYVAVGYIAVCIYVFYVYCHFINNVVKPSTQYVTVFAVLLRSKKKKSSKPKPSIRDSEAGGGGGGGGLKL